MKTRAETNKIIIHCSATKPSQRIGVKEIRQWHKKRGFAEIGYHYVITRRGGTVQTGRDATLQGAHARSHNADSIGICLVGGLTAQGVPKNNFNTTQWRSLELLVRGLQSKYNIPDSEVYGHNHFSNKACPCFDVKAWIDDDMRPLDPRDVNPPE